MKNNKTGKIRVYPSDVAKAEIRKLASQYGIEPRDIALFLVLYAKPGVYKEGEIHYKYHLNKMLFYQWKKLEEQKLDSTFFHDDFEAKTRGPVPRNLSDDLERLKEQGLISTRYKQWGKGSKDASLKTELTRNGMRLVKELWDRVPDPLKQVTSEVKEMIFPMSPSAVQKKVHREYPEYKSGYIEPDTE
ncbi:MAG: hypothetical protein ACTSYO_09410 [Candidatus Ranarchaeia archaeon]